MISANSINLTYLRQQVRPFRVHWVARARSTNDLAIEMRRRRELFAPAIVIASRQTRGRGRGANTWWSAEGSLTATFALPVAEHLRPHQVPLIAGLAVREAIQALLPDGVAVQLKWPNDLLVGRRKLVGLLGERIDNIDLIGIGVNVNVARSRFPVALKKSATSLQILLGRPITLSEVIIALAERVRARLSRHNDHHFGAVLREYDRHHALVGRRVVVQTSPGERIGGTCVGLDRVGRLLLRHGPGEGEVHRIVAGHVSAR